MLSQSLRQRTDCRETLGIPDGAHRIMLVLRKAKALHLGEGGEKAKTGRLVWKWKDLMSCKKNIRSVS